MKINLSKKIIISIESVVLITIILIGVIFFVFQQRITQDEVNERLSAISNLKGEYISQYLNDCVSEIENGVKSMHIKMGLIDLLQGKSVDNGEKTITMLTDGMISTSSLVDLSVINSEGLIVGSNNKQEEGKIKFNESYFQDSKEHTSVKNFVYDALTKQFVTIISTPIKDDNGNFMGILSEKINNKDIDITMEERSGLQETGETFLINKSHIVITNLLKEPDAAYKKIIYTSPVNICLEGNSNYYSMSDYHGDKVFGYARWISESESCIITKIDQNEIFQSIFNMIPQVIALTVIIFIFTLILGFILGISIIKPLGILRNQAIKIKEGNLDVVIEPTSHDEIGDLAIAFKEMLVKLKELYSNLEGKVKERTQELENSEKKLKNTLDLSEKNNKMMIGRELEMIKLKEQIRELEQKS